MSFMTFSGCLLVAGLLWFRLRAKDPGDFESLVQAELPRVVLGAVEALRRGRAFGR